MDAEIIEKVEKKTVKFLANAKGERNWMTVLKNRSKEIKASKARLSCGLNSADSGGQTESQAAEPASSQQTLQDSTKAETPPKVRGEAAETHAARCSGAGTREASPEVC